MRAARWALAAALLAPSAGAAQDIEALSARTGVRLPAAYWEAVRERPDRFELPNGLFRAGPAGAPLPAEDVHGEARLPVVLALFADSPEPHITPGQVAASLFTGPAPAGTLTQFYEEISGGRFRLTGEVFPWVRTSVTRAEVVANSFGLGDDAAVGAYLREALARVDANVDFSRFDSDGPDGVPNSGDDDGVVDAVAFEFLEVAASCGGPGIWPHRSGVANWGGGPFFSDDAGADGVPVIVNGYIVQSVADCSGVSVQSAATTAHEYGHVLGLPDFYHPAGGPLPENRRWVLGCWELMAAGSWGCGPVTQRESFGPTHMMAPQKVELGWATLDTVAAQVWDREFVLEPVQTSGRALYVPLGDDGQEALILEYRPRLGFDRLLPAEGVLITHEDLRGSTRPREGGYRYRRRLVEADGNLGLVRDLSEGGNRGEAGDAFAVAGAVGELHALTSPALVPNATGRPSTVTIHSVRIEDGLAYVRLSTGRTPRVVAPPSPLAGSVARPLAGALRIAGGRMPYTVLGVEGAPDGLGAEARGDDLAWVGAPGRTGAFEVAVRLGDADGTAFDVRVPVTIDAFLVERERLLQAFLQSDAEPLAGSEAAHLDGLGNRNGAFDVGDVRAWLLGGGAEGGPGGP